MPAFSHPELLQTRIAFLSGTYTNKHKHIRSILMAIGTMVCLLGIAVFSVQESQAYIFQSPEGPRCIIEESAINPACNEIIQSVCSPMSIMGEYYCTYDNQSRVMSILE
jgi:hypothetical protein